MSQLFYFILSFQLASMSTANEIPPGTYGAVVRILLDGKPKCTGSILDNEWVATAAQCVVLHDYGGTNQSKIVKRERVTVKIGTDQLVNVIQIIVQEKFDKQRYQLDMAVFRVTPKIVFDNATFGVNLPPCQWTNLTESPRLITFEGDKLVEKKVTFVASEECDKPVPAGEYWDTGTRFCSKDDGKEGRCKGEPGSPLYVPISDLKEPSAKVTFYMIGQLSPRETECGKETATGYIRMSYFIGWIYRRTIGCGNYVISNLVTEP